MQNPTSYHLQTPTPSQGMFENRGGEILRGRGPRQLLWDNAFYMWQGDKPMTSHCDLNQDRFSQTLFYRIYSFVLLSPVLFLMSLTG